MVKNSVAQNVRQLLEDDLSIQDSLHRGYGNVSAVARLIKPRVEEKLGKRLKLESIVTAVKRAKGYYRQQSLPIQSVLARSTVSVRTDIGKISVEKSRRTRDLVRKMLIERPEDFIQVSESSSVLTMIINQAIFQELKSIFSKSEILEAGSGLAAITISSPPEIVVTPGCATAFYNQISRRRINIEDTVSCHTDTIIVVKMDDVGSAFSALTELVATARKTS